MAGRIFEMQIESLKVGNRGTFTGKEDVLTLGVTLVYPRAGVRALATVKTLDADKPIPDDFSALSYHHRVLFKENIVGESQLTVEVIGINKPTGGERFFANLAKTVFNVALSTTVVPGIGNLILAGVVGEMGESIFDNIEAKESVQRLGTACISVNTKDRPLQAEGTLEGELLVFEDITETGPSVLDPETGLEESEMRTVLNKGVNGKVVISYREVKEPVPA